VLHTNFPGRNYSVHGHITRNSTMNGHLLPSNVTHWPVFSFVNHRGYPMHHLIVPKSDGGLYHRIGFAPASNSSSLARRDDPYYNEEYFSSGALDLDGCSNADTSDYFSTESSTTTDFDEAESQIECYVNANGGLSGVTGFEFQLYDATAEGTIGSGSISAADSSGDTVMDSLSTCPTSMTGSGCGTQEQADSGDP
jgi:hypothetical protein